MGTLTCPRCGTHTEADSIEEGRKRLDHSRGLLFNKPCEDGRVELDFTGNVKESKLDKSKTSNTVGKTNKTKKNQSKD